MQLQLQCEPHAPLSLLLSLAALCGASIKGFSVFPTCLPHEILFISCVLSSLFRPHQVQIAVQAWMDEEDRVKSYTTKMEMVMEICKDETKWNEMKYICIWKTYERAGEEEEAEKLTQKRKTKLESQRENLWEPKLKSRKNATASSVALISGWKWKNLTQGCWTCHRGRARERERREREGEQAERDVNKNVAAASADAEATTTLTIWMLQLTDTHSTATSACIYVCV